MVESNGEESLCGDCAERAELFAVGDRIVNTRPNRYGEPNGLPEATIIVKRRTFAIVRYDDDPEHDPGYSLDYEHMEKIA